MEGTQEKGGYALHPLVLSQFVLRSVVANTIVAPTLACRVTLLNRYGEDNNELLDCGDVREP